MKVRAFVRALVVGLLAVSHEGYVHAQAVPGPLDVSHKPARELYRSHIRNTATAGPRGDYASSLVRYSAIAGSDAWAAYRRSLERTDPTTIEAALRMEQIAWWMNTYHVILLTEIAAGLPATGPAEGNLPPQSPLRIPDLMTKPVAAARGNTTLEEIRKKLASFGDYRAVLLLHDGTIGGAPVGGSLDGLQAEPMQQRMVESQLDALMQSWCAAPQNVRIDSVRNRVVLSTALRNVAEMGDRWTMKSNPAAARYNTTDSRALRMIWSNLSESDRAYITRRTPKIEYAQPDQSLNLAP